MPNFELTASSLQSLAFQLPASILQLPGSRLRATYSSCKPVASRPRRKVPKQNKKKKKSEDLAKVEVLTERGIKNPSKTFENH